MDGIEFPFLYLRTLEEFSVNLHQVRDFTLMIASSGADVFEPGMLKRSPFPCFGVFSLTIPSLPQNNDIVKEEKIRLRFLPFSRKRLHLNCLLYASIILFELNYNLKDK